MPDKTMVIGNYEEEKESMKFEYAITEWHDVTKILHLEKVTYHYDTGELYRSDIEFSFILFGIKWIDNCIVKRASKKMERKLKYLYREIRRSEFTVELKPSEMLMRRKHGSNDRAGEN